MLYIARHPDLDRDGKQGFSSWSDFDRKGQYFVSDFEAYKAEHPEHTEVTAAEMDELLDRLAPDRFTDPGTGTRYRSAPRRNSSGRTWSEYHR